MTSGGLKLAIIVAASENGVIGRVGDLPWRLSADLRRFKKLTMGRPIVMGRRTWESIGKPLPGRTSIVVTRNRDYDPGFAEVGVASDLAEALDQAAVAEGGAELAFVIGGAELYRAALPKADVIYLTRVRAYVEGDVYLPSMDLTAWRRVQAEEHAADDRNEHPFCFEDYERIAT